MDHDDPRPRAWENSDDHSLPPRSVAETRLVASVDAQGRPAYRLRGGDGTEPAVLTWLGGEDRPVAFEDVQRLEVPVDGCWEISVVDAVGGLLENRILFGGPHPADDDGTPPEGIAAWAKLTVSWALTGTAGGRG